MPTKDPKKTTLPKTNSTNAETAYATTSPLARDPRQFKLEPEATIIAESL